MSNQLTDNGRGENVLRAERIERFIEDEAYFRSCDLAPHPSPPSLSCLQIVSLSQSSCVSPVQGEGGGKGWAWSRIIRSQEGGCFVFAAVSVCDRSCLIFLIYEETLFSFLSVWHRVFSRWKVSLLSCCLYILWTVAIKSFSSGKWEGDGGGWHREGGRGRGHW